jgi:hypothetical protein
MWGVYDREEFGLQNTNIFYFCYIREHLSLRICAFGPESSKLWKIGGSVFLPLGNYSS